MKLQEKVEDDPNLLSNIIAKVCFSRQGSEYKQTGAHYSSI